MNLALFSCKIEPNVCVRLRSDRAHPSIPHIYFAILPVSTLVMHSQTVYIASVNTDAHSWRAAAIFGPWRLTAVDELQAVIRKRAARLP